MWQWVISAAAAVFGLLLAEGTMCEATYTMDPMNAGWATIEIVCELQAISVGK